MSPSRVSRILALAFAVPFLAGFGASLHAQVVRASSLDAPQIAPPDSSTMSRGRLWGSFPLAVLLGTAGMAGGALAGYLLLECEDESSYCERGPDSGEFITGAAGLALGAAVGAYLGGLRRDSRGRFWVDLLAASGGALFMVMDAVNDPEHNGPLSVAGFVAATLAATTTDYLVRQPRGGRRFSIQPLPLVGPVGLSVTVRM